jgi:hypothetical protein
MPDVGVAISNGVKYLALLHLIGHLPAQARRSVEGSLAELQDAVSSRHKCGEAEGNGLRLPKLGSDARLELDQFC